MGGEVAALLGLLGLSSAFALVGLVLSAWMAWRIVEKAGLPGWTGMGAVLLTLTTVGAIVPLILLWVFAFIRWPRDDGPTARLAAPAPSSGAPAAPVALPPPLQGIPDRRGWRLAGRLASGNAISLAIDGSAPTWLLTGGPAEKPTDLSVPDPSVGTPHARLLVAANRLGLEDLGSPDGTFIDGARLLPEHGPRDVTAVRTIRLGSVELTLTRA